MMAIIRRKFQNLLKAITEQNQKQFGTQRMDCCDLKKDPPKKK